METVQCSLLYILLVCSLFSKVKGQCSGSAQNLNVGYSAVTITPPGYPNGYVANLNCTWLALTSIVGKVVLFRVTDMTLNCAGDAINVYDGTSTSGTQIHTNQCASGSTTTSLGYQEATSGNVYSVFTSDASSSPTEKGFKMYLISTDDFSGTGCSGSAQYLTATATEQYLSSPNFPSAYTINKNCTWTITTSNNTANVFLRLRFMDIEHASNCTYDYLEIVESGTTFTKLCREDDWEPTETFRSTGQTLTLSFFADNFTPSKRGFMLSYIGVDHPLHHPAYDSDGTLERFSLVLHVISLTISITVLVQK